MTTNLDRDDLLQTARIHILERSRRVELPIDEAFAFYGDAHSLTKA